MTQETDREHFETLLKKSIKRLNQALAINGSPVTFFVAEVAHLVCAVELISSRERTEELILFFRTMIDRKKEGLCPDCGGEKLQNEVQCNTCAESADSEIKEALEMIEDLDLLTNIPQDKPKN